MIVSSVRSLALVLLVELAGFSSSRAALVTLTASDAGADTSFTTAGHWSNGLAPSAGNTYSVDSGYTIRTPGASGSYTFGGDALTISGNGTTLVYKGTGAGTDVLTANNLILANKGAVSNFTSNVFTLNGTVTVNSGQIGIFRLDGANAGYTVASTIAGSGSVSFTTNAIASQTANKVAVTHANNTYTGGTTIGVYANVAIQADGALGTGNLIMNGGKLTLELGTLNNYIADTANFVLASGLADGAVTFNFTGTDAVAGLSLNGGSTYLAAGLYDATTLNSLYGSSLFTGTGTLNVVPEPQAAWLLLGFVVWLGFTKYGRSRMACQTTFRS